MPDLIEYCAKHEIRLVTIAEMIEYRRRTEVLVERAASVRMPTEYGEFQAVSYRVTPICRLRERADRPRLSVTIRNAARNQSRRSVLVR